MIHQIEAPGLAPGGKGNFKNQDKANIQRPVPGCNAPKAGKGVDILHTHFAGSMTAEGRQYVLAWLRVLHSRGTLICSEIADIGVALKGDWISADDALDELAELDPVFLDLIGAIEVSQ
jgi:hypothetical protein